MQHYQMTDNLQIMTTDGGGGTNLSQIKSSNGWSHLFGKHKGSKNNKMSPEYT